MARLRHLASGKEHPLSARHLIGRAPTCALCIDDPAVSGYHAELTWNGEAWTVQDLGSRNGTTVDGRPLPRGEHAPLSVDGELVLADKVRFALVDASPPTLIAIGPQGELREAAHELLCLPSDELPELTLFRELDGRWWVETDSDTRALGEAEHLVAGGVSWRVHAPISVAATREAGAAGLLSGQTLRFVVSRDGEHVELSLVRGAERIELPSRSHQFLLLALARARLADAAKPELPEAEQGWVYREDLPRMLAIQLELVHLWIHRARKQLAEAGMRDAATVIERRASGTQIRIGVAALEIVDQ
ncbi:MAG: FHA domain-containing protein [Myxococcales bacterium]|nr:FHA domain-containing protein [Myxococcales bacterium]